MATAALLLLLLLVLLLASTAAVRAAECKPKGGTTRAQCEAKLDECAASGAPMKWVGRGCRNNKKKKRQVVGDGGCQCAEFCNYQCKQVCNRDAYCKWDGGRCLIRADGAVAGKWSDCSATRSPSPPTDAPTRRPSPSSEDKIATTTKYPTARPKSG